MEKIAEPLGITYDLTRQEGKYLTLQKGDTTLVFPRYNESTVLLNGHEMAASYYLCDYDHLYVPLRFVVETFGGKVQYVDDYEKTFCNEDNSEFPNRVKVNVIAIEMPDGTKPQYVSKDGMEKIIDVSVQYQQDLIAAREEANQKIEEKFYYDASAVTYTGKKLGRFYVYELKEFENLSLIHIWKSMYYSWTMEKCDLDRDILDFFSEIAPCGVIGSFLLDQVKEQDSHFSFKHHYITSAMDSEILCSVFMAIREKRSVILETYNRHKERVSESHVVPLRVMVSAQSGRQYLIAYAPRFRRILSFRTDHIASVKIGEVSERFDQMRQKLDEMQKHMWGVSTQNRWGNRMAVSYTHLAASLR